MANILLTGASRGIGAAARVALEQAGHSVIGQSTAGGDSLIAADFANPRAADALWAKALELAAATGERRIDVLVNNAGVFEAADIADGDGFAATWARSHAINLQSAADLCRHAVLHFQENGGGKGRGGRIINVASRAGHRGDSPQHWHYAAAKAGMLAMTKTIARGYAGQNILAFAITPGFTMTGMAEEYLASRGGDKLLADIPLGRVASPQEVAEMIRWLASDAPASMTGATLDINGASYVR
ncbi:SDR family oxidoreductase [Sandarakinorhabdus sp.]|uniref:SDR family NAD(P)-dependent oxidoreductase n=1 Tax=Sandarakinorhabdus sp. TaxID=1916663 RepID=UPI00286E3F43|nr:SDR family oxidoreductase [Sandarakinorhabdus sp.]